MIGKKEKMFLAGREFDAWIAEHLFGWRWMQWDDLEGLPADHRGRFLARPDQERAHVADMAQPLEKNALLHVARYSTDRRESGAVLTELIRRGWWPTITFRAGDLLDRDALGWHVELRNVNSGNLFTGLGRQYVEGVAGAEEEALAICRAAEAAVEAMQEKA